MDIKALKEKALLELLQVMKTRLENGKPYVTIADLADMIKSSSLADIQQFYLIQMLNMKGGLLDFLETWGILQYKNGYYRINGNNLDMQIWIES